MMQELVLQRLGGQIAHTMALGRNPADTAPYFRYSALNIEDRIPGHDETPDVVGSQGQGDEDSQSL